MIRGAIEVAERLRIAGWMYAAGEALRDKTVLAFVGSRCVGAGKVDQFRRDLLEAGLGDGYAGFDFPVRLTDGETVGSVIVRLQYSDMALIQTTSRIAGTDELAGPVKVELGAIPPASVSWMLDRGMLDQPEYDFLKGIHSVGAYERGLRATRRSAAQDAERLSPEAVAHDMLSLLQLADVRIVRSTTAAISDLVANQATLLKASAPVVALWSQDRGRILLEERSHHAPEADPASAAPVGGVEYCYGPDRLLFLHRTCRFAPQGPSPASGITILSAASPEAATANVRKPARAA